MSTYMCSPVEMPFAGAAACDEFSNQCSIVMCFIFGVFALVTKYM